MLVGNMGAVRPAIIWAAMIMSKTPATTEMPGAIATTAHISRMAPKDRLCRVLSSQARVKWSVGASSCNRCNKSEARMGFAAGGVGFTSDAFLMVG
jgi:hypothetical protein